MSKLKSIPVIDLFAGPGGLAEGFSSVIENDHRIFDIRLSIEKDKNAAARKKQLDKRNGVPFVVINGRGLHGFSAAAYERALEGHP